MVLDGLERADRDPELTAVPHVVGRHLQHAICQPALLGCDSAHAPVVRAEHREAVDRARCSLHLEEPAGAIDGGTGDERHLAAFEASGRGDDHVGGIGPGDVPLARGDGEVGVSEQRHGVRGGLDDGLGHRVAAGLLEDEDEVDERETEPTRRLGRQEADHSHGVEVLPETRDASAVVCPRRAHVRRRALLRQEITRGISQRELLVGEREVHAITRLLSREAEHAFGDHVALDLVGACVDRPRERELVALHPRRVFAIEQLRMRTE